MTAPTHVVFGFSLAVWLAKFLDVHLTPGDWAAVFFGSLAPDIDAGNAVISRPGSLFRQIVPRGIGQFIDSLTQAISRVILRIFGHRKSFHWPLWPALMMGAGVSLDKSWLFWFGWGYLSHIIADFCTTGGVPIFGPFSKRLVRWSPLRTGSKTELVLFSFLLVGLFYSSWDFLPEPTRYWLEKYKEMIVG